MGCHYKKRSTPSAVSASSAGLDYFSYEKKDAVLRRGARLRLSSGHGFTPMLAIPNRNFKPTRGSLQISHRCKWRWEVWERMRISLMAAMHIQITPLS